MCVCVRLGRRRGVRVVEKMEEVEEEKVFIFGRKEDTWMNLERWIKV